MIADERIFSKPIRGLNRHEYPLEGLLKLADIPRSTYYYILKRLDKQDKYASERQEIHAINAEHKGRYGYRRVTIELRKRGYEVNHKVVMRLMKEEGLTCRVRMKKYRSYRGTVGKVAPNIINRDLRESPMKSFDRHNGVCPFWPETLLLPVAGYVQWRGHSLFSQRAARDGFGYGHDEQGTYCDSERCRADSPF